MDSMKEALEIAIRLLKYTKPEIRENHICGIDSGCDQECANMAYWSHDYNIVLLALDTLNKHKNTLDDKKSAWNKCKYERVPTDWTVGESFNYSEFFYLGWEAATQVADKRAEELRAQVETLNMALCTKMIKVDGLLDTIKEWRKGCSNAPPNHPELCPECTRAAIDTLQRKIHEANMDASKELALAATEPKQ